MPQGRNTRRRHSIVIITVIAIAALGWTKAQLHNLGSEIGSAQSEISKYLYLVESSFNHRLITKADTGKQKLVALTFDDGPDPNYTPSVLAILKKYNIKATFFVIGKSAEAHPVIIKQMLANGNEVENHTYTHPNLRSDSGLKTEEEIRRCDKTLLKLTGRHAHYFRPPKGLFKNETIEIAAANDYRVVLWTICIEHHRSKTPADMAERIVKAAKPGMIILAHDGRLNREKTVEALPQVITEYQKMGYQFVTLDKLMQEAK